MSPPKRTAAVTGAFSYSGSHIARQLMARAWEVITLTRRPERPHPLREQVRAYPLDFANQAQMQRHLQGVDTLVNTYWVRFNYPGSSFAGAVENTGRLLAAAQAAGVRRLVHLSVSNPNLDSELPYYRGKAQVEDLIKAAGLSYAILQPTLIFGPEEVLLNNITWLLRRFPLFPIPGDGQYRLQPIYVEDLAELAAVAVEGKANQIFPAGGPEVFTFAELLRLLTEAVGSRTRFLNTAPGLALTLARAVSSLLGDVMLTPEELAGLMQERLYVGLPSAGATRLSDWLQANAAWLGQHYAHELKRHHQKA